MAEKTRKNDSKEMWKVQVIFRSPEGEMWDAIYKVIVTGFDKIREDIEWRVKELTELGITWEIGQYDYVKKVS